MALKRSLTAAEAICEQSASSLKSVSQAELDRTRPVRLNTITGVHSSALAQVRMRLHNVRSKVHISREHGGQLRSSQRHYC